MRVFNVKIEGFHMPKRLSVILVCIAILGTPLWAADDTANSPAENRELWSIGLGSGSRFGAFGVHVMGVDTDGEIVGVAIGKTASGDDLASMFVGGLFPADERLRQFSPHKYLIVSLSSAYEERSLYLSVTHGYLLYLVGAVLTAETGFSASGDGVTWAVNVGVGIRTSIFD